MILDALEAKSPVRAVQKLHTFVWRTLRPQIDEDTSDFTFGFENSTDKICHICPDLAPIRRLEALSPQEQVDLAGEGFLETVRRLVGATYKYGTAIENGNLTGNVGKHWLKSSAARSGRS